MHQKYKKEHGFCSKKHIYAYSDKALQHFILDAFTCIKNMH